MTEQNVTSQGVNPWIAAAQNITPAATPQPIAPAPARDLPVFVAAHGGAGATSWAHILGGVDGGLISDKTKEKIAPDTALVLVARASIDGVDAAKAAIAIHGYDRFACVLLVPASPGKMPRIIAGEVKVLSGALGIILTPWTPSLLSYRAAQLGPTNIAPKELNKIIAGLTQVGLTFQGETK